MARDAISDLWVPAIWTPAIFERTLKLPSLFNSRAVVRSPLLTNLATGPGQTFNIPHWKDLTDQADAVQAQDTASSTTVIGGGKQIGVALNREWANGIEALAAQHTGNTAEEALQNVYDAIGVRRLKGYQRALIYSLRGFCASAASAVVNNIAIEDTDDGLDTDNYIDGDVIIDAAKLLGEAKSELNNGVIVMHSTVEGNLRKQDSNAFVQASIDGGITITRYKGMEVIISDELTRAGTGSPATTVYETYLFAPGAIAFGEKAQSNRIGDVASLVLYGDASKNNQSLYDRVRYIAHINGAKFTGTPSGESPTNAELATSGNWALAFQTASRCGFAQIRSNG
jgi:hypothetical protein